MHWIKLSSVPQEAGSDIRQALGRATCLYKYIMGAEATQLRAGNTPPITDEPRRCAEALRRWNC